MTPVNYQKQEKDHMNLAGHKGVLLTFHLTSSTLFFLMYNIIYSTMHMQLFKERKQATSLQITGVF